MSAFGKRAGACHGRDFNFTSFSDPTNGFSGVFFNWMTEAAGGPSGPHGANWYLVDDQRGVTLKYAVFCNKNNPAANTQDAVYCRFGFNSSSGSVRIDFYDYWDSTNHVGWGYISGYTITTVDAGDFSYDFRGGPECLYITSRNGSSYSSCFVDTWDEFSTVMEPRTKRGVFVNGNHWNDDNKQIVKLTSIVGQGPNLDVNNRLYFQVVFVSGTNYRVDVYKEASHTTLIGRSGNFTALAGVLNTISVNVAAQGGSGFSCTVSLKGPTIQDLDIVHQFVTYTLTPGFDITLNKYYYVSDFSGWTSVRYLKVTSIVGNEVGFDVEPGAMCFGPGAVISAYDPRIFTSGITPVNSGGIRAFIPYNSRNGNESWEPLQAGTYDHTGFSGNQVPAAVLQTLTTCLTQNAPDDENYYDAHRCFVQEYRAALTGSFTPLGNRRLGLLRNTIVASLSGMLQGADGRNLTPFMSMSGGCDFVYMILESSVHELGSSSIAVCFRDTESA